MPPKTAVKPGKAEGVTLLVSTGQQIQALVITAETLYDLKAHNMTAQSVLKDHAHLIFSDEANISVLDENGELHEEATADLTHMIAQPKVDLWQKCWLLYEDVFFFGSAFFNPVWDWLGNVYSLAELNYLPANSFAIKPSKVTTKVEYSLILKGVLLDKGTVQYWQTQIDDETGDTKQVQINNIFHVRNPETSELAGLPILMPVIPYLHMEKYSWNAQMQTVNRAGAPIATMKITNPAPASEKNGNVSDVEFGNAILQNWGKDTAYMLRSNMELIILDVPLNPTAKDTVDTIHKYIYDYFSPKGLIQTGEKTLIGGSERSAQELVQQYTRSIHRWIANSVKLLLQPYLDANGYEGYSFKVELPVPQFSQRETELLEVDYGFKTKSLTLNERRRRLGEPPLTPEQIQEMVDEYELLGPAAGAGAAFGAQVILPSLQADGGALEDQMDRELRARRDKLIKDTLKILR